MPAKTLYIPDDELSTWAVAEEVARQRHLSLSAYITKLIEDDLEEPRLLEAAILHCILCAEHPQAPGGVGYAKYVINGMSVCGEHKPFAMSSHDFHSARTKMMHDHQNRVAKIAKIA
jgi:hypothetical protein